MKTDMPQNPGKKCNCRRGMIIVTTLFFLTVAAAVFSLALLYDSMGRF